MGVADRSTIAQVPLLCLLGDDATMSAQGDDAVDTTSVVIKQSTAAVPVRQGWQTGLFACDDDGCEAFCWSAWFPCVAFASIADIVDQGSECQCLYCGCYLVAANFGMWWMYAGWYRRKLREQYGLPETPLPDCITHLLCHTGAPSPRSTGSSPSGASTSTTVPTYTTVLKVDRFITPLLTWFRVRAGWDGRPQPAATAVPRVQVPMTRS
ncbi:unnamed protein product [Alopecurus aequalis]